MKNNLLAGAAMQSTKRIMAAMLCATMFLAGCSTDTEAENPLPESSSEVEQQSEQVDIEEEKRTEVETAIALTEAIYGVDAEGLLNLMQQDALNYAITKSYTTRAAFAQELGEMLTYIADLQATEMDIKDGESIMMYIKYEPISLKEITTLYYEKVDSAYVAAGLEVEGVAVVEVAIERDFGGDVDVIISEAALVKLDGQWYVDVFNF